MNKFKKLFTSLFVLAFAVGQLAGSTSGITSHTLYAEEENKTVTLDANDEINTNYYYSATCYVSSVEGLSALSVSIYYDESVIEITDYFNNSPFDLYDGSNNNSAVNFSYLFSGNLPDESTSLFCFHYRVKSTAISGRYFFDIVINEAYDSSLNSVHVTGGRKYFNATVYEYQKSTTLYGTNDVSTSMFEEFEIQYYINNIDVVSGAFNIVYDSEYFEAISVTPNEFFENKMVDYNINLAGTIYISFLSNEYANSTNLFTIRFKTIKNETNVSQIELTATELYDLELDDFSSNKVQTSVNVAYDPNFDINIPVVSIVSSLDEEEITLTVRLTADSHLGAGDFVLTWDKDYVEYVSYQKLFTPSFFNVNTKEIANKKVKFSIISLTDIVDANNVLSVTFNTSWHHDDEDINFTITGSGLTDSLTNPISLNFVNCSQVSLGSHNFGDWETVTPATYTEEGLEKHTCTVCDYEETRAIPVLEDDPNHYLETSISAATLYGQESDNGGVTTVNNIAIRFGGRITKAAWDEIEDTWPVTDYGVMLVKKTTLENTYGMTSVEQAYRAGKTLAIRSKVSSGDPYELPFLDEETNNYYFTLKVNITGNDYSIVYCAAPFIVAGGQYYFLDEMRYSVKSLAQHYLSDDNYPYLTNAGLQYLINY